MIRTLVIASLVSSALSLGVVLGFAERLRPATTVIVAQPTPDGAWSCEEVSDQMLQEFWAANDLDQADGSKYTDLMNWLKEHDCGELPLP